MGIRETVRKAKALLVLLMTTTLVACGGGGGGGSESGFLSGGGTTTTTPSYTLSLSTADASGSASTIVAPDSALTVTVNVSDNSGSPVASALVSLTTEVATVSPENGSALTDASGNATFTVSFNDTEGAGNITATYTRGGVDYTAAQGIQSQRELLNSYVMSLETATPSGVLSPLFSSDAPLSVTASLLASDGITPVAGALLQIATSIGSVEPTNGQALTNAQGQAQFSVVAGSETGAGVVSVSYGSGSEAISRQQNVQAIATSDKYSLEITTVGNGGILSNAQSVAVIATLSSTDPLNYPVADQLITLENDLGIVTPGNGNARTDANGEAEFLISYDFVVGAGVATVSFISPEGTISDSAVIESRLAGGGGGGGGTGPVAGAPAALAIVLTDPQGAATNLFSAANPLSIAVQIVDVNGDVVPVDGELILIEAEVGTLNPANGQAVTQVGTADYTLTFDETVGAGFITATWSDGENILRAQKAVQSTVENPYELSLARSGGVLSNANPITVTVTVVDDAGQPIAAGEIVEFATTLGALDVNSALTNAAGQASFDLRFNGEVGAGVVSAQYTTAQGTFSNSLNIEAVAENPYSLTLTRSPGMISVNNPIDLSVTVLDAGGQPVGAGEIVTLATTVGRLDQLSALTNAAGQASFTLSFAGQEGAGTVTARYTSAEGTFSSSVNIESVDEPYSITLNRSPGVLSVNNTITVSVTVLDVNGQPIPAGEIINISTSLGALNVSSALTDATGQVGFEISFNGQIGAGTITARYTTSQGTVSNSVNIEAVNVPPSDRALLFLETETPAGVSSAIFSVDAPLTVTATLFAADGVTPLAGEILGLATTIGSIVPSNGQVLTDALGQAQFALNATSVTGAGVITVTYDDGSEVISRQQNVQAIPTSNKYTLEITTVSNDGILSNAQSVAVIATLSSTDPLNYPVADQLITLENDLGVVTPGNGNARTNADGEAEFLISYDFIVGAGVATVSFVSPEDGTLSDSAVIESRLAGGGGGGGGTGPVAGAPAALAIVLTDPQGVATNLFSAANPLSIAVQIVDVNGDVVPVDGELIALDAEVGTVSPSNGQAVTQGGEASFGLFFDGTVGGGFITATWSDGENTLRAQKAVQSTVENPYSLTLTRSAGVLSINNAITVTATVLDDAGNPVGAGEIVSFSTTLGSISVTSALTDAAGQASVELGFNGQIGAGTVTARYTSSEGTFSNSLNIEAADEAPPYSIVIDRIEDAFGATNTYSSARSVTVWVRLEDALGVGLDNRVVSLSLSGVSGVITPNNRATLTDNGDASFTVGYGGATGAGQVTATFNGPLGSVSDVAPIEAIVPDLDIGTLDNAGDFVSGVIRVLPGSATVSYRGSIELFVAVANAAGTELVDTAETLRFSSGCLNNAWATLDSGLTTTTRDGVVAVTYSATENCSGTTDTVTVELVQPGVTSPMTASVDLTLAAEPGAGDRFLTFVAATPRAIALQGTGGGTSLEERSLVTFEILDGSGEPVGGQSVVFTLSTETGGISLSDTTGTTDGNGQVSVTVNSGILPTPVRVIATTSKTGGDPLLDEPISVVSDQLSISAGIATQARFAVVADTLNPARAAVVDGVQVRVTASAYDRFGNPVPDGTTVNFSSQCGGIGVATPTGSCTTVTGRCFVNWVSQPSSLDQCEDNRITILGYLTGEERFEDTNANGTYEIAESFDDNSEAYRDDNESAAYDSGEYFVDAEVDGIFATTTPLAGALFNGLACPADSTDCSRDLVSVYANLELVAGPDDAADLLVALYAADDLTTPLDPALDTVTAGSYVFAISDGFGNVPPLGTSVTATATGECEVISPAGAAPNSSALAPYLYGITVRSEADDAATDDYLEITYSIPGGSGNEIQYVIDCTP